MIFYRLLFSLAFPVLLLRLGLRCVRGRESLRSLTERLGGGSTPRTDAALLWLHGASNGELTSARDVLQSLLDRSPSLQILVTTNTQTGRDLAIGWGLPRLSVAMAPLDHQLVLARFLNRWQPRAMILVESELWPNRLALCAKRAIPTLMIGARISAKSTRPWAHIPGLSRTLTRALCFLSAQDAASEARFRALGLTAAQIGPVVSLKSARPGAPPADNRENAPDLPFARAFTLLAASTHDGEEVQVLDAFAAAQRKAPDLRLILAPRHPRRRDAIEAEIRARGLTHATRSRHQPAQPDTLVYLADTMGEMDHWYRAAGMTFVGGSLTDHGGHTPFEPTSHGSAILHGPYLANFVPAYAALTAGNGALAVKDAPTLASTLTALAGDSHRQNEIAQAAVSALAALSDRGGLVAFYAALARAAKRPELAG
ncbi:MAG: glycosyltransferase N-terminal domain-containing protein [Albidovulum sp.]